MPPYAASALAALAALSAAAASPLASCPNCAPVPVAAALPWFSAFPGGGADGGGAGFSSARGASARLHNRPLYGDHNGGLALAGDLPIAHVGDDGAIYGGLLFGLRRGATARWAHASGGVAATFARASVGWDLADASLPGLALSARLLHAASGTGLVLDVNVTDDGAHGTGAEFIWAFGCGAPQASAVGWANDPLVNPQTVEWTFTPKACMGNRVAIDPSNASLVLSFGARTASVSLSTNATSSSIIAGNSSEWDDPAALLGLQAAASPAVLRAASPAAGDEASPAALPVAGAILWLRAASLAGQLADGAPVAAWADESGGGAVLAQATPALQPRFASAGLGAGTPAVRFDGEATFLASAAPNIGAESTMLAVIRDDGSTTGCCSGVLFFNTSCNGISTLTASGETDDDDGGNVAAGAPIVTTLDYAGSPAYGHANIRGRVVVAGSVYTAAGPSFSLVDNCPQYTASVGGTPSAGGLMVGTRNNELARFFRGVVAEVVVFDRALNASELGAMHAYLYAAYPAPLLVPKRACEQAGPLPAGRSPLAAGGATRFTLSVLANAPPGDPAAELAAAEARALRLTRTASSTPEPLVDAALQAMGAAVDGLFRANPGAFVHGAMAWDSLYLGWRSEYGATVLGWPELVAEEGRFFFAQQILDSPNTKCHSNPDHRYTDEASDSRFHGKGRIDVNGGIYDMQTQFFDQQIHVWRWTGNTTHEGLLRPALKLHEEWARESFDADGNGLYSSYTNTWPTDSQWYNGGETHEETAYMFRTCLALRDMAARAGNASEAAEYGARAELIRSAVSQLWVAPLGIPAAFREEGGHRRLRPDPWLYSVFVPIEARGLWDRETAAQALFFTEFGLERDPIFCDSGPASNKTCGEVVWTSNWVPSMWSVRQMWSGDNSGLALAYFLEGQADEGFNVLSGNMRRDMLQSSVPGSSGGANGGTDFNDAVHPMSRALVEGLFGYRPDYVAGVVEVAPQFPSAWPRGSFSGADVSLSLSTDPAASTTLLTVQLTRPAPALVLRIPLRAASLGPLSVAGIPSDARVENTTEGGYGQTVLVVRITAGASGAPIAGAAAEVAFSAPLPCTPSVLASATEGAPVAVSAPAGLSLLNVSDPQGVFAPGSVSLRGGQLAATVAAGVSGRRLVFGYAATDSGLPQTILFKLDVAPAAAPAPALPAREAAAAASWSYVPLGAAANADLRDIFKEGTYLSPRPETCAVRIGSDGWSGWTFPYWNGPWAPQADFGDVANLTVAPGPVIETPQGARFLLSANASDGAPRGQPNIAFATLWDAFPHLASVPVAAGAAASATGVWALVAGSTNPMQTRLSNAELRLRYADGSADTLELVPPLNFWALSGWGQADYSYSTDAFCLSPEPPPTVQLGANARAMVYFLPIAQGKALAAVELEAMSQEVVIGLLAVSLTAA